MIAEQADHDGPHGCDVAMAGGRPVNDPDERTLFTVELAPQRPVENTRPL